MKEKKKWKILKIEERAFSIIGIIYFLIHFNYFQRKGKFPKNINSGYKHFVFYWLFLLLLLFIFCQFHVSKKKKKEKEEKEEKKKKLY